MSDGFEFEIISRYEGPQWPSDRFNCECCKKPLKVWLLDIAGVEYAHLENDQKITHHTDGTKTVETFCRSCLNAIFVFGCQINNYSETGDPDDFSWMEDDEDIDWEQYE
jgi:hypothetical protein